MLMQYIELGPARTSLPHKTNNIRATCQLEGEIIDERELTVSDFLSQKDRSPRTKGG